jgi:uncharacterized protein HemX
MSTPPPPTIPAMLWALAGLIFKREALLVVASLAVIAGIGAGGAVWAQSRLDGGVAPVVARVEALERQSREDRHAQAVEAEEQRRKMASLERVTMETSLNVRLLLEQQKIQPVVLDLRPVLDGGR